MNTPSDALRKLAGKVLRAEIAARRAVDVEAVEAVIAPRLRLDADGEFRAVDRSGSLLPGLGLVDVLDDLARERPDLFRSHGTAPKSPAADASNPFAPGSGHSVTAQMMMWRTDPERAEHLAAEAGVQIKRI